MNADDNVISISTVHNFAQTCHQVITCLAVFVCFSEMFFSSVLMKVLGTLEVSDMYSIVCRAPCGTIVHACVINVYNVIVCITLSSGVPRLLSTEATDTLYRNYPV